MALRGDLRGGLRLIGGMLGYLIGYGLEPVGKAILAFFGDDRRYRGRDPAASSPSTAWP